MQYAWRQRGGSRAAPQYAELYLPRRLPRPSDAVGFRFEQPKKKSTARTAKSKAAPAEPEKLAKLRKFCKKKKLELYPISAVTGEGIDELKYAIGRKVQEIRAAEAPVTNSDTQEPPRQPRRKLG